LTKPLQKSRGGWTDFDVSIATPDLMGKVGRLGRVLGPRGLMQIQKAGTVVPAEDLPRVINESKAGRVEFRVDKTANLHVPSAKPHLVKNNCTIICCAEWKRFARLDPHR